MKDFMKRLDRWMNIRFQRIQDFVRRHMIVVSSFILVGLLVLFVLRFFVSKPQFMASIVSHDLTVLADIVEEIDKECNILSINNNYGVLDFLTVEKFAGSQIGCLNLAFPHRWKGPYLQRNITMQGKFYNLVKTTEGLFVVPGDGVELPTGQVVGRTLLITPHTSIRRLMEHDGPLAYRGYLLAREIDIIIGDWDGFYGFSSDEMESIGSTVDSFNQALPFASSFLEEFPVDFIKNSQLNS